MTKLVVKLLVESITKSIANLRRVSRLATDMYFSEIDPRTKSSERFKRYDTINMSCYSRTYGDISRQLLRKKSQRVKYPTQFRFVTLCVFSNYDVLLARVYSTSTMTLDSNFDRKG